MLYTLSVKTRKKIIITAVIFVAVFAAALLFYALTHQNTTNSITNYQECVAKGYPVQESYPSVCRVPGNSQTFTNPTEAAPKP
jgi:hypothetical protein